MSRQSHFEAIQNEHGSTQRRPTTSSDRSLLLARKCQPISVRAARAGWTRLTDVNQETTDDE